MIIAAHRLRQAVVHRARQCRQSAQQAKTQYELFSHRSSAN
jgi:hypothetical protein